MRHAEHQRPLERLFAAAICGVEQSAPDRLAALAELVYQNAPVFGHQIRSGINLPQDLFEIPAKELSVFGLLEHLDRQKRAPVRVRHGRQPPG